MKKTTLLLLLTLFFTACSNLSDKLNLENSVIEEIVNTDIDMEILPTQLSDDNIFEESSLPFGSGSVLYYPSYDEKYIIIDLINGKKILEHPDRSSFVKFIPNSCNRVMHTIENTVIESKFHGEEIKNYYSISDENLETYYYGMNINVSGDWISYIVGTGNQEYSGFEFEDVEIVSLVDTSIKFMVSNSGKSDTSVWDNSGKSLAITDVDDNGVYQIFVYSIINKSKTQITFFNGVDYNAGKLISWSPNDSSIAFSIPSLENPFKPLFGILNIESGFLQMKIIDYFSTIDSAWWFDEESIIISGKIIGDKRDGVYRISNENLEILTKLPTFLIDEGVFRVIPFGDQIYVGFLNDFGVPVVVDFINKRYYKYENSFIDPSLIAWYAFPDRLLSKECN